MCDCLTNPHITSGFKVYTDYLSCGITTPGCQYHLYNSNRAQQGEHLEKRDTMTATCGTLSHQIRYQWDKPPWFATLVSGLCALLILLFTLPITANAEAKVDEYDLKAVYLYNFSKFISWPENRFNGEDDTFNICINGPLPSSDIVSQLLKRTTQGRALHIRPLGDSDSLDQCHIVYFRDGDPKLVKSTLSKLKNKSVLTVGDYKGFATSGGVVEFIVNKNNKLELIINQGRAKADGIEISAQLLEIASVVHKGGLQ